MCLMQEVIAVAIKVNVGIRVIADVLHSAQLHSLTVMSQASSVSGILTGAQSVQALSVL